MIEHLRNLVREEVARALDRRARRIPAIVDSYDPDRHAVKVKMQPEGTLSGWLSIETPQVGSGFGVVVAPNIGDPGWLEFHEDDFNAGVFVGSSFNERFKPPSGIVAGEMLLKHKSGSSIHLMDDGTIAIVDKEGSYLRLDGAGNLSLSATVKIFIRAPLVVLEADDIQLAGNVSGAEGASIASAVDLNTTGGINAQGDVTGGGHSLSNHKHGGVQSGGAQTGTPIG